MEEDLEETGIDIHVVGGSGGDGKGSTEILENQLLPDPLRPLNHSPWVRSALWGEGKTRVSQGSRVPCGITFKTLSLAIHSWLPPVPLSCLGIGLKGFIKLAALCFIPTPLSAKPDSFTGGILVFLSFLMLFPAAVHFYPSPTSTHLPPFLSLGLLFSMAVAHNGTLCLSLPLCARF